MLQADIERAKETFGELLASQTERIEKMKAAPAAPEYENMDKIIIGVIRGDGIGPYVMKQALRVVNSMLAKPIADGRIEIRFIPGLSVDERRVAMKSIPDESLEALLACDIILKGPLDNTSIKGLGSSVAAIRRALDLTVNLRPVKNPILGYDWVMFRENIEGAYIWGSKGIQVDDDLAVDFVVETKQQSTHLARMAFEYARKNGRKHVSAVTKCNVIKLTDGNFLNTCREVAKEYPEIDFNEKLIDITASKMTDAEFNANMEVLVLPNLYGDIISDVAAEVCGGVGTAGSANIGSKYALFEAIHGTAQMLVDNGRAEYANPSSLLRAVSMLFTHIGYKEEGKKLSDALDICGYTEKKLVVTSFPTDASAEEYTDYVLETVERLK
ncbi:MAG: isocitrate/isopropylmalate dehydrogenase family protein [Lachnospiraceae bacterium]|nr:isocitrate/isopropylmalate dehydrogenase family protein [Lachnospiraceae bacterium]